MDSLALERNGVTQILRLENRQIERVAIGLMDFGSFQDRIMLELILSTNLGVTFTPKDENLSRGFRSLNEALNEIREQYDHTRAISDAARPFFNCWFVSVPQILILLDDVADAASFKQAFWNCRHFTNGGSDFYAVPK